MKKYRKLSYIACILFMAFSCQKKEGESPNVLFISIDDLRPDLGCYGNTEVESPNIDQIAAGGYTFNKHFVQVPTCGASRYTLLTGNRPSKRLHLRNDAIEKEISNSAEAELPESFIHQLRRNGYHTVGIGKISHSADGLVYGYQEPVSDQRELPFSWDELLFDAGKWKTGWNAFFAYANGENRNDLNGQVKPYEAGKSGYPDELTTKLALEKLKELKTKDKPFFMGVGYFKPHLPFNSPEEYWNKYKDDNISVSENPLKPKDVNNASLHQSSEFNRYALGEEKAGLDKTLSDPYAKNIRKAYYSCISYIDNQVGQLVAELERLDLAKNTIIVIWGDHGWHLGDQQVWGKHTLFERALKSALIVKIPNSKTKNTQVNSIVETVDIYPSILELCNIKPSHEIDGRSFVNMLKTNPEKTGEVAYSYFKNGISLRTDRYRLTKYFREELPNIELYDHQIDPLESINIAEKEPEIVLSLMQLLDAGNTGLYLK